MSAKKLAPKLAVTRPGRLLNAKASAYTLGVLRDLKIKAGGRKALADELDITHAAIWKWEQQGAIPVKSLPAVTAYAQKHKVAINMRKLRPDLFTAPVIDAV